MLAFLTGSQVYGTPNHDSDYDLVIRCDSETKQILIDQSDNEKMPCMFGKLNIIFATNDKEYHTWRAARDKCKKIAPISRELAYQIHEEVRQAYGIKWDNDSGDGK